MRVSNWTWGLFWSVVILGLPLIDGGTTYIPVTGLRLLVLVMGCVFLVSIIGHKDSVVITSRLNIPALLFWALALASLFITRYEYITVYWCINIMIYMAVFYLGLNSFGREGSGRMLVSLVVFLLVIGGTFQGAFGAARYFLSEQTRATGTFFNPGFYAGYLIATSPLALALLIFPSTAQAGLLTGRVKKLLLSAGLLAMVLGMMCSGSRAVVAAVAAMGLVLVCRFKRLAPAVLVLLVAGVVLIPNPLRERVMSLDEKDMFAWERVNIWRGSVEMISDHPQGVGLGMYKYHYYRHMRPIEGSPFIRYLRHADTAHSEPLHIAAEMSPLAALVIVAMAVVLIIAGFRASYRDPPSSRALLAGLTGALAGISLHSMFDSNLHNPSIAVTAMIVASLLSVVLAETSHKWLRRTKLSFSMPRLLQILVASASIILFGLFALLGATYGLYLNYSRAPDPGVAAEKLMRLSKYAPGYSPINFKLGKIGFLQYERGQDVDVLTAAIRQFDRAFHINPENYIYPLEIARGHLYLAYKAHGNRKLLGLAEHFANLSLKRHPRNVFTYYLLARIAAVRADLEARIAWLEEALEIEPFYFAARGGLVESLLAKNDVEGARREFDILRDRVGMVRAELDRFPAAFPSHHEKQILAINKDYLDWLETRLEDAGR